MTALTIPSNHIATPSYVNDLLIRIAVSLQLTPTQYRDAVRHYEAVAKWLSAPDSPLARFAPGIFPQGSLRIGTTVARSAATSTTSISSASCWRCSASTIRCGC